VGEAVKECVAGLESGLPFWFGGTASYGSKFVVVFFFCFFYWRIFLYMCILCAWMLFIVESATVMNTRLPVGVFWGENWPLL